LASSRTGTHAGVYQNFDYPVLKLAVSKYPVLCFADLLRKYRKINGLYQEHLAKQIGVDRATIHNWETEKYRPHSKYDLSPLKLHKII